MTDPSAETDRRPRPNERRNRAFLFLQGPSSPLFQWIADGLAASGHSVHRINLCAGDRVFWWRKGAFHYRGTQEMWPAFLAAYLTDHAITEILLLGEERPYHRAAALIAAERGLVIYSVEMGYLRPDWISIEYGGNGCNSHFPASADHILAAAEGIGEPDFTILHAHSFLAEAACDLAYNLANVFLWFLHPHYCRHALAHPFTEYVGWIRRMLCMRRRHRQTADSLRQLNEDGGPVFLYALQLETDYQIRVHSPFHTQRDAIALVLGSFAESAASDAILVVKTHPLDSGVSDLAAVVLAQAERLALGNRVHVVHDTDFDRLVKQCRGVVTINSSAGLKAVAHDRPVKVLGTAIYDLAGLTHQGSLESFWRAPEPVDSTLRTAFIRLIAASLHERGSFYSWRGAGVGAQAIATRINAGAVNQPDAYVAVPPRPRPMKGSLSAGAEGLDLCGRC